MRASAAAKDGGAPGQGRAVTKIPLLARDLGHPPNGGPSKDRAGPHRVQRICQSPDSVDARQAAFFEMQLHAAMELQQHCLPGGHLPQKEKASLCSSFGTAPTACSVIGYAAAESAPSVVQMANSCGSIARPAGADDGTVGFVVAHLACGADAVESVTLYAPRTATTSSAA